MALSKETARRLRGRAIRKAAIEHCAIRASSSPHLGWSDLGDEEDVTILIDDAYYAVYREVYGVSWNYPEEEKEREIWAEAEALLRTGWKP